MHCDRLFSVFLAVAVLAAPALAEDAPATMWGGTPSRNLVSSEVDLPVKFDLDSGLNIKWVAELGSQSYAGPILAGGKVFVGTNNQRVYNEKLKGDRGNVMAFDAETGAFIWQSAHAKLGAGRVNDWPLQGVCSTPAIEGDRLWYVSNQAHVVCADVEGFRDGENDGPFTGEKEKSELDVDIVWSFDLIGELDVFPHNLAAGSPLLVGDIVYAVTGQGVDEGHVNVPAPMAPSLVALNKKTGELLWEHSGPGEHVLHGSWSNPSYAVLGGTPQVIYPGGDGWLYAFEPDSGKLLWKFDLNPKDSKWMLGGRGTRNNVISTPVIVDGLIYIGVGQDPEHGEGPGHLYAIDPAGKSGEITTSGVVWHVGGDDFHRTMSSAAVQDGLLYIADLSGFVYCLDAKTGKQHWKYDTFAAIWASTFVADGKVYIGDEDGDLAVLRAGKKMELLFEGNLGASVYTTPIARDGVMYVATRTKLIAIEDGIPAKKPETPTGVGLLKVGVGMKDLTKAVERARNALDEHVRKTVEWHFDPESGCPFWLEYARKLDFDPREKIRRYDDLKLLGHFEDEWLRGGPVRRWVPKALADQPLYVFETGGSTGVPKSRVNIRDFQADYEAFGDNLPDDGFPPGADWLMLGPTGPRRLRLAIEHLAQHRDGISFHVDLDPRWVGKLVREQRFKEMEAYKAHVIDQALTILRAHDGIRCLFTTPKLLEALCEKISLSKMGIRGIFCGGTEMNAQFHRFAREELVPGIEFVPTYGNTLMGLACPKPFDRADDYAITYYPPAPRAVFEIVDPEDLDRPVDYGARGRVLLTTLTPEFFMPRFPERDEGFRAEPCERYPWDGVRDLGLLSSLETSVAVGVY